MNNSTKYLILCASSLLITAAGCGGNKDEPSGSLAHQDPDDSSQVQQVEIADIMPDEYTRTGASAPARLAFARVQAVAGSTASGLVAFIQPDATVDTIRVVGKIIDIPVGNHGFHLHEIGDCTAPEAGTAGEHFNPEGTPHGGREGALRHVGDLGNLVAGADRIALLDFQDEHMSLATMNSVIGKAFIIHAAEDDLVTQPSGNSGTPIACGVIGNNESVLQP